MDVNALTDGTDSGEFIRIIFNGPVVAGVGANTDAGIPAAKYHRLPWDPKERLTYNVVDSINNDVRKVAFEPEIAANVCTGSIKALEAWKYARYNVESVYNFEAETAAVAQLTEKDKESLKNDMIGIVFLLITHGYYGEECVEVDTPARASIVGSANDKNAMLACLSLGTMNRAATFLAARCHTKYQTNHAVGGTPISASFASSVRALYEVNPSAHATRNPDAAARVRGIVDGLYWAVHPMNETVGIPMVLTGTKMTKARVHARGVAPKPLTMDDYFVIRENTPPAGTHHYFVARAAINLLEPLGIVAYLPDLGRASAVVSGFNMIKSHGAALHPAARYWGLNRVSSDQKTVESLCADLGYAVRKLMSGSSLSSSPILMKEDLLNIRWKSFIDSLRDHMDTAAGALLDQSVLEALKQKMAPTLGDNTLVEEVKAITDGA